MALHPYGAYSVEARPARTMKAIVYHEYGSADVLELGEINSPVAGDGEVLVRVRAASVNPCDWHLMCGLPYFVRVSNGLRRP